MNIRLFLILICFGSAAWAAGDHDEVSTETNRVEEAPAAGAGRPADRLRQARILNRWVEEALGEKSGVEVCGVMQVKDPNVVTLVSLCLGKSRQVLRFDGSHDTASLRSPLRTEVASRFGNPEREALFAKLEAKLRLVGAYGPQLGLARLHVGIAAFKHDTPEVSVSFGIYSETGRWLADIELPADQANAASPFPLIRAIRKALYGERT